MPLVRHLFAQWSGAEVGLVLDRTDIEDRWSFLMLAAAFRHGALPLVSWAPHAAPGHQSRVRDKLGRWRKLLWLFSRSPWGVRDEGYLEANATIWSQLARVHM